jgi:hypothetical protein
MTRADRIETVTLAVILATVAVAAGWASFTHVHDWTMRHAPQGTPDAFGWVNAVISELVPVAAFLTIRRRRAVGAPIGYPLFLLIAAATLSLAAQLAVAQPSPSGWLLSAVPALAFMALVKLVFAAPQTPATAVDRAATDPPATDQAATDQVATGLVPAVPEPLPPAPRVTARPATVVPVPAEAFTRTSANGKAVA